jgi:hypothetical protein
MIPASGIYRLLSLATLYFSADRREAAPGLLRCRLGGLCRAAAWMLAAPNTDLSAVENAIVVGVHLIEPGRGSLTCPLFGAFDELVSGDPTGGRRCGGRSCRAVDGGSLRRHSLGQGRSRQQKKPDQGSSEGCTHLCDFQLILHPL